VFFLAATGEFLLAAAGGFLLAATGVRLLAGVAAAFLAAEALRFGATVVRLRRLFCRAAFFLDLFAWEEVESSVAELSSELSSEPSDEVAAVS